MSRPSPRPVPSLPARSRKAVPSFPPRPTTPASHSSSGAGASRLIPLLDVLYPNSGPCAFCGFPDQRHRMADAIVEQVRAGDSAEFVAENYELPVATVQLLVERWDDKRSVDRGA